LEKHSSVSFLLNKNLH